jgi:hypothetical protein
VTPRGVHVSIRRVPQLFQSDPLTAVLLLIALALFYFVGRVAISVVPVSWDTPLLRAVIFAFPVLAMSLGALYQQRLSLAAQLPIAASLLALTIGVGLMLLFRPARRADPSVDRPNRSWALLLPAIGMIAIAGAVGQVDAATAIALALFGLLAVLGWRSDRPDVEEAEPYDANVTEATLAKLRAARAGSPGLLLPLAALVAIGAACGLTALSGVERLAAASSIQVMAPSIFAAAVVVPLLLESLGSAGPRRALSWRGGMSSMTLFALINLCFVLPAVAMTHEYVLPSLSPTYNRPEPPTRNWSRFDDESDDESPASAPATAPGTQPATTPVRPEVSVSTRLGLAGADPSLPLPQHVWRADVLALSAAALLLIPLAAGLYRPGWIEALALMLVYLLDALLSTWFMIQM